MLKARIPAQLEEKLRSATVIDASDLDTDIVRVGTVVHVTDGDGEKAQVRDRRICRGQTCRDEALERVSSGQALMGRKKGEDRRGRYAPRRAQAQDLQNRSRLRPIRGAWSRDRPRRRADLPPRNSFDVFAARRQKLAALRASGIEPFRPRASPMSSRSPRCARHMPGWMRVGGRQSLTAWPAVWRHAVGREDGVPGPRRPLRAHPAARAGRRARTRANGASTRPRPRAI